MYGGNRGKGCLWRRPPRGRSRPCSHRQTPNLGIPCRHRLGFGVVSNFPRRRRGEQMCDRQEPLFGTLERKRPKGSRGVHIVHNLPQLARASSGFFAEKIALLPTEASKG